MRLLRVTEGMVAWGEGGVDWVCSLSRQAIVLRVAADPEPNHVVAVALTNYGARIGSEHLVVTEFMAYA